MLCIVLSNRVADRRNKQRVNQALAASPITSVPSPQHSTQHQLLLPVQHPTPSHTRPNIAYGSFDLSSRRLFTALPNGVADVTPPAITQQHVTGSSSSYSQHEMHQDPQPLPNHPLDTLHSGQAPNNTDPNGLETLPSSGQAMMPPPATKNKCTCPESDADPSHLPVLHYAVYRGNTSIASILLDQSRTVNEQDSSGRTPLHVAAMTGHTETAKLLIARGALVNAKDHLGRTPIHWAALGQHDKTFELLISKGANVNAADNNDWTVVHICAERGWEETLTMVLKAGGDLTRRARKCGVSRLQEPGQDFEHMTGCYCTGHSCGHQGFSQLSEQASVSGGA